MHSFNGSILICIMALAVSAPTGSVVAAQAPSESSDLTTAERRLDRLRSERGSYDPALLEAWLDIAAAYRERGAHGEAAEALQSALQISRITDGLYATGQLPVIRELARALEEDGQRGEADVYHHLLFHTRSRLAAADSPARVDAILDWGDWKLRRFTAEEKGYRPSALAEADLQSLLALQEEARDILAREAEHGDDSRHGRLLFQRVLTRLGLAGNVLRRPAGQFDPPFAEEYITRRVCRDVGDGSGGVERVCSTYQVRNPRYRAAQVAERRTRSERELRLARRSLTELREWHEQHPDPDVSDEELQDLHQALRELGQGARRHSFGW